MRSRRVDVDGGELRFRFKGESGKEWKLRVRDRRLARIVRSVRKRDMHPEVMNAYVAGSLLEEIEEEVECELRDDLAGLEPEEAAGLAMLQKRLSTDLEAQLEASLERERRKSA